MYNKFSECVNKILHKKYFATVAFCLLIISFFAMGVYNTYNYSVTVDEPAHLGAAESYRWHEGVNPEHPPLMKVFNAILIRIKFPNYKTIAPTQYAKGAEFLWLSEYNPNTVLQHSRFVYLTVHAIIFLWFWYYTFLRKLINKKFALVFLTLFVFSPTVITINPLLIFDIAGAIGIFMGVFSSILLFYNIPDLTNKQLIYDTIITSFAISFALLSKFTNLYLIPVFTIILILSTFFYFKKGHFKTTWKRMVFVFSSILTITLANIWLVYSYAYKNLPYTFSTNIGLEKRILIPFWRMYDGAMLIYNYVQVTPKPNFVDNKFVYITYQQFINRVFWFKENPILIVILLLSTVFFLWYTYSIKNTIRKQITLRILLISMSAAAFPIIYFLLAKDKMFSIGFRHFLSVEIFIFAGLAALIYFASEWKQKLNSFIVGILLLYSVFGALSLQKGVGYTNLFWQRPNWELANDSTVFLAEYQKKPLEYLYSLGLLKPNNNGDVTFIYRGHYINQQMAIHQITGSKDQRYESYNIGLNPINEKISESKAKYLIVDIFWFHEILDSITTKNNNIAKENWDFLQKTKPVYNYNNAVYIYNLTKDLDINTTSH